MASTNNPYAPPVYVPPDEGAHEPERLSQYDPAKLGPPTMVRYGVLGLTALMSVLLYLDRFAISVVAKKMRLELDIDEVQMGYAMGFFFLPYALAQVPSGWLSDKLGSRLTLTLYVAVWSITMAGMGLVNGVVALVVLRVLLGIGQAGAYPAAAGLLKNWVPLTRRGVANSIVTMGGRSGGLITNVLTPALMALVGATIGVATGQWRYVFIFYGVLGLIWALIFGLWFRNTPRLHPGCNESERALIEQGRPIAPVKPIPSDTLASIWRFLRMLMSPNLWVLNVINFCVNVGWIFLVTWLPTYLMNEFGLEEWQAGLMTSLAGLAGMAGNLCGGLSTDFLVRRIGITWGRRLPGLIASIGAGSLYATGLLFEQAGIRNVYLVCLLFAGCYLLIDFGLGSVWAVYQDIGGKQVATVLGFTNMCGNLGAFGFTIVIGYLAKADNWPMVFMLSAGSFAITATCWLFVNPRQTMEPASNQPAAI